MHSCYYCRKRIFQKWFVVVSLFDHHQSKYGIGIQQKYGVLFLLITIALYHSPNIKCQVVYTKAIVNFGHVGLSLHCITIALMYMILYSSSIVKIINEISCLSHLQIINNVMNAYELIHN